MGAEEITVKQTFATIESVFAPNIINAKGVGGTLTNIGTWPVFISSEGDPKRTGLQLVGEIELAPGDTIPLPAEVKKIWHATGAAPRVSKLWYIPLMG